VSAKRLFFSCLFVVICVGFISTGPAQALDFKNWEGTWFTVKSSETGRVGPAVPPGGDVITNNEKTITSYLVIETFDITAPIFISTLDITVPAFVAGYCVPTGSSWIKYPVTLPILGGEPVKFLTLFTFQNQETPSIYQESWIPLEVKGSATRQEPNVVSSASFKNLGGIFKEEITLPAQGGVGSVKFTGSFIKPDQVSNKVPAACIIQ